MSVSLPADELPVSLPRHSRANTFPDISLNRTTATPQPSSEVGRISLGNLEALSPSVCSLHEQMEVCIDRYRYTRQPPPRRILDLNSRFGHYAKLIMAFVDPPFPWRCHFGLLFFTHPCRCRARPITNVKSIFHCRRIGGARRHRRR